MIYCDRCRRRNKCVYPCKHVEDYINQDNNTEQWAKMTFTPLIDESGTIEMPSILSTTEIIVQNYFLDRMSIKEIAIMHYKSRQYVSRVVAKYKRIMKENLKKKV